MAISSDRGAARQSQAVASRFRAIAAHGHVAPAAARVPRPVEEHACASRISAAAHARQLSEHHGVRSAVHDGDQQAGKRVADGNERACERAIITHFDAARSGAPAEHAIDLFERVGTYTRDGPALRELPQGSSNPTRLQQDRGRARRLLFSAPPNGRGTFHIQHASIDEPARESGEARQSVGSDASAPCVLRVHEVQP